MKFKKALALGIMALTFNMASNAQAAIPLDTYNQLSIEKQEYVKSRVFKGYYDFYAQDATQQYKAQCLVDHYDRNIVKAKGLPPISLAVEDAIGNAQQSGAPYSTLEQVVEDVIGQLCPPTGTAKADPATPKTPG